MVRLLLLLALLCLAALGLSWLADHPGQVGMTWQGYRVETSLMAAMGGVVVLAIVIGALWALIRFVFRLPSLVSLANRARRSEKGFAALSRGMVAVGAGDTRAATRHAAEAQRLIGGEPLTHLLRAQAAQLAGDRQGAEQRSRTCSRARTRARLACAACMSRRAGAAITKSRSNMRPRRTRSPRCPGRPKRCSTIARRAATGPARSPPSRRTPPAS